MSGGFERVAAAKGPADLSTLIALRALVDHANGDGTVERATWLTAVREEYRRWYARHDGAAGHPQNFPAAETVRYLDEHIVRALEDDGLLEPLPHPGPDDGDLAPAAEWAAVRLTPWAAGEVDADRQRIVEMLDARIGGILNDGAPSSTPLDAAGDAPVTEDAEAPSTAYVERASALVPGGSTLKATGLVKTYRKRRVVNEVDLHVSQGEIVGLLGPNGAGKTTSFYMMVGLIRPDKGKVFVGGREITRIPMFRRARAGIGYLAQEPSIFRKLTVEENVMAILQMMRIPRAERKRRLETLLDELSIKHVRKSRAYALSGGERRRLEITRALVGEPKFMLLDEPFAGVDPIAVHDIQQIVSGLRKRGIGVLISDHNVEQTLDIVDRAYIMYDGRVRVSGTVSELVWNDEVAEIYLGPTLTARMRERYPNPALSRPAPNGHTPDVMDEYGSWPDQGEPMDADGYDEVLDEPELAWAHPADAAGHDGPAALRTAELETADVDGNVDETGFGVADSEVVAPDEASPAGYEAERGG
ncbi:MAG TPA: LPS export ABC transporter ATP-binding protein [Longimicrobium sp.]|jgi:lipopolysaccharide export system ATP-binding protein